MYTNMEAIMGITKSTPIPRAISHMHNHTKPLSKSHPMFTRRLMFTLM
jgi:hypothetical protein